MNIPNPKILFGPKIKKVFKYTAIIVVVLAAMISVKDEIEYQFGIGWAEDIGYQDESIADAENTEDIYSETCNVSGVVLHGELVTYISPTDYNAEDVLLYNESSSEDIIYYIEQAEKDDKIKAIIMEVDSYGGNPVADEEVADALKSATKPTVALIRGAGLSAAYYAATGADIIFASQDSDIGSIGVTMSYLDNAQKNQNEGITFNQISSGKYKDLMNPDKSLTGEEKELLMRDIKIMNENFIKAVAENRKLDIEKVRALADGSSMLGEMALKNGLIDKIGGENEVKEYLKEKIGEEVEICW